MKILLILATIYLLIYLLHKVVVKKGKLEKGFEISNLTLKEIREQKYYFLQNIVKCCTSIMDPRPIEVIKDYKAKGWQQVIVCSFAVDYKGRDISGECYSLWGQPSRSK